jgi:hypothetical protein
MCISILFIPILCFFSYNFTGVKGFRLYPSIKHLLSSLHTRLCPLNTGFLEPTALIQLSLVMLSSYYTTAILITMHLLTPSLFPVIQGDFFLHDCKAEATWAASQGLAYHGSPTAAVVSENIFVTWITMFVCFHLYISQPSIQCSTIWLK